MKHARIARTRRAAVLVATAALATACTIPVNEEPVELSASLVPETTTSTSTTSPEVATRQAIVYFLETIDGSTTLEGVPRSVEVGTGLQGVLSNLFTQIPRDDVPAERGLTSAIPESAVLQSVTRDPQDEDQLVIDVRGLFGSTQGADLRNALAQIVWTATEADPGVQVEFRQDGEPRDALVDNLESTADPVDRGDYLGTT